MKIVIYTTRDADNCMLRNPPCHTLLQPYNITSKKLSRAEYEIPYGYTLGGSSDDTLEFYNDKGHQCPLVNSPGYEPWNGRPALKDVDATPGQEFVKFAELRNLPWEIRLMTTALLPGLSAEVTFDAAGAFPHVARDGNVYAQCFLTSDESIIAWDEKNGAYVQISDTLEREKCEEEEEEILEQ